MAVGCFGADDPAGRREQDDQERSDGESAVESQRGADRRGLVGAPVRDRTLDERPRRAFAGAACVRADVELLRSYSPHRPLNGRICNARHSTGFDVSRTQFSDWSSTSRRR